MPSGSAVSETQMREVNSGRYSGGDAQPEVAVRFFVRNFRVDSPVWKSGIET
jgi:hypothetical protein